MTDLDPRLAGLVGELESAHGAFATVVAALSPEQAAAERLVGEWGLREIVAHLGYWAGNAAEALHRAELGASATFGAGDLDVEERNALVARIAGETDLATIRAREEAAFGALMDRVRRADPSWLEDVTAGGETVGFLIRDDGVDHYREHAAELRVATSRAEG